MIQSATRLLKDIELIADEAILLVARFVEWFEGDYEDYEKDKKRRLGVDADQPHRIKYRRIDA